MTLRLPPELEAELRVVAEEDHRNVHQTVLHAIETYLALRETAEIKADPPLCALSPRHGRAFAKVTSSMAPRRREPFSPNAASRDRPV
jgi:hypothetical protein